MGCGEVGGVFLVIYFFFCIWFLKFRDNFVKGWVILDGIGGGFLN